MSEMTELQAFCTGYLDKIPQGMPDWQIALIGSFLGYFVLSGVAQRAGRWSAANDGPIGLLWPFILPWKLGEAVSDWATKPRVPKATAKERTP